jgi:putative ABC transport system permease protein
MRYDLILAMRSIRTYPVFALLVVAVIAIGIGTSVLSITLYHAKSGNPIWWKNDVLFRVMIDSRPADHSADGQRHPEYPPFSLIYQDALALYKSSIPTRSVMMFYSDGVVDSHDERIRPVNRSVRVTTSEFFSMFDVPFLYGHGWSKSDDAGPSQVVVLSSYLNDRLYGGRDSIGQTLSLSGQEFRVIGVLDKWLPLPRFYDEARDFGPPDDLFIPFRWIETLQDLTFDGFCLRSMTNQSTFAKLAPSECISTGLWVELSSASQRRDFSQFLDNYTRSQKEAGRFDRPLNNRLADVSTWLEMNDVVGGQSRLQLIFALIFLGICCINTMGLLLAKFIRDTPNAGIRRALGASRRDIIRQYLVEAAVLGSFASAIGIGLAAIGLRLIRLYIFPQSTQPHDNPDYARIAESLSHMDGQMVILAIGLSLAVAILAGLYPAWRVGRSAPASFLKAQ